MNDDTDAQQPAKGLNVRCPYCGIVIGTVVDSTIDIDEERNRLVSKHQRAGKCTAGRVK